MDWKKSVSYLFVLLLLTACSSEMVVDSEGNEYKVITIGDQKWTSSNLVVTQFNNGDEIPRAKTAQEWEQAGVNKEPAWCYYQNKDENGTTYGALYNWYAVTDERGLAPEGFRIPTDEDWKKLEKHLGGGDEAGKSIKSDESWNNDEGGFNKSRFSALPGGYRNYKGDFEELGTYGAFWSSTESVGDMAWYRYLFKDNNLINRLNFNKEDGMSVRCVKDVVK